MLEPFVSANCGCCSILTLVCSLLSINYLIIVSSGSLEISCGLVVVGVDLLSSNDLTGGVGIQGLELGSSGIVGLVGVGLIDCGGAMLG